LPFSREAFALAGDLMRAIIDIAARITSRSDIFFPFIPDFLTHLSFVSIDKILPLGLGYTCCGKEVHECLRDTL
jgi:hypothetical protein